MSNIKSNEACREWNRRVPHNTPHLVHTQVYIVGSLTPSEGSRYPVIIIDRNTMWPEAIPIQPQMVESCVKALIGWVSRHGIPQVITSDRGANFTSSLWHALADSFGTKIVHTTAYNPEANSIIKSLHQSLKSSLTTRCQGGSWGKEPPWVLPDLRTSPHAAFHASPAEALYGQALTLLADIFQHPTSPTTPSDFAI